MFGWYVPTNYFVLFKSVLLKSFSKKKMFLTKDSNLDKLILRFKLFANEPKLSSIN